MSDQTDHIMVLEAGKTERHYWRDLWRYRELFFFLSWKDILVRYKQTVIGIAWSIIRPLLTMVVFTFVFGQIAQLPSQGAPYPILVFSAMLPWQYFSNSFSEASNSLILNTNFISKIYFPRLIIPTSTIIVSLVDFLISMVLLGFLMAWYGYWPDIRMLALPLFLLLGTIVALGTGFYIAALNVKYRDFRYVVPFIVQFGLYISPVGFDSTVIPAKWRLLYSLNPMVGVIDGFRWCIIGGSYELYMPSIIASVAVSLIFLAIGVIYFRKVERTFADVI